MNAPFTFDLLGLRELLPPSRVQSHGNKLERKWLSLKKKNCSKCLGVPSRAQIKSASCGDSLARSGYAIPSSPSILWAHSRAPMSIKALKSFLSLLKYGTYQRELTLKGNLEST